MNKKYRNGIYEMIHQNAVYKFKTGVISEERMLEYDNLCLVDEDQASRTYNKSLGNYFNKVPA